jgi:hypothetical protein
LIVRAALMLTLTLAGAVAVSPVAAQDVGDPLGGRQVITAEALRRAGVVRVGDVLTLAERWDVTTIDGMTWQASADGLAPPEVGRWTVLVDGVPLDLGLFGALDLNRSAVSLGGGELRYFASRSVDRSDEQRPAAVPFRWRAVIWTAGLEAADGPDRAGGVRFRRVAADEAFGSVSVYGRLRPRLAAAVHPTVLASIALADGELVSDPIDVGTRARGEGERARVSDLRSSGEPTGRREAAARARGVNMQHAAGGHLAGAQRWRVDHLYRIDGAERHRRTV